MLTAIIVAGGSSQRMGFDKLFALLDGKPVLFHSVDAFEKTASVTEIILVGRKDQMQQIEKMVREQHFEKVREIVAGGAERQDSVRAGLARTSRESEYVAVHDAARPLITSEQIECVLRISQAHRAAALAEPIKDTLKRATEDYFLSGSIDRDRVYAMQTPQIFSQALLVQAYDTIRKEKMTVTDEVSAVEYLGQKVVFVPNDEYNFKITYPRDLPLAEFVIRQRLK